jgi:P-type E1-E2 ATPase
MIELTIPGRGVIQLEHLVCDVNGTLALDGRLLEGMVRILSDLRSSLSIHILSADTHGNLKYIEQQLQMQAVRITSPGEAEQKADFVRQLGPDHVIAVGQGANDAHMLQAAAIGICLISPEGTAVEALLSADLIAADIFTALELIEKPLRLVATLRK